jgi:DNA polymerase (family 10)
VAGYYAEITNLDEKGLTAIPNVGAHLAHKLAEHRQTGSVDELDDLRARVPAGLRTLLAVPALGPKRARQVYDQLGLTSPWPSIAGSSRRAETRTSGQR